MSPLNATLIETIGRVENVASSRYNDKSTTHPTLTYSQAASKAIKGVAFATNSVAGSETDESDLWYGDSSDIYTSDTSSEESHVAEVKVDDASPKARLRLAYQESSTSIHYFNHKRDIILNMFNIIEKLAWILSPPPPVLDYTQDWHARQPSIPDINFNMLNSITKGVPCNSPLPYFPYIQGEDEFPLARLHYKEIIIHFWFPKYRRYSFPLVLRIWDDHGKPVTKLYIAFNVIYAAQYLNKAIKDGHYKPKPSSSSLSTSEHDQHNGLGIDMLSLISLVHARGRHFVANLQL
ncbi:hypothetical protein QCA50_011728 [Cerrena zonata]|uniref:Uncharacterized protein n=1 Tax=Cerrena zonata TaxID=2478898 RepID=A0AAW0FWC2_9APHY